MVLGSKDRYRLVHSHRYQEALLAFEDIIRAEPSREADYLDWKATMLLCLDRLDEALAAFTKANDGMSKRFNGAAQPFAGFIGAAQWMLKRKNEAIATLRRSIDGLTDGTITYSDTSNGAPNGLLLWYFGVSMRDNHARQHALRFLKDLSEKWPLDEFWPGPIALCILERMSFDRLPLIIARELEPAINEEARSRGRRQLESHSLFYQAVSKRSTGDEVGCLSLMRQCSTIENPIHEEEWYLARHETPHQNS